MFDVSRTGATGDGKTDDTAAILAARNAAVTAAVSFGSPQTLFFPAGRYRITAPIPIFQFQPIGLRGEGSLKSLIVPDPTFGGDIFSWDDAWGANNFGAGTVTLPQFAGVTVEGLGIIGNRASPLTQNGFVFYDRADFAYFRDVSCFNLTGRGLYSGITKVQPLAYMRESRFHDMRFWFCGNPGVPSVEFTSSGTVGDATNELSIRALDIFAPQGPGLVIRNSNPNFGVRNIKMTNIRIEGQQNGTTIGDLLQIGDPVFPGNVNNLAVLSMELIDPYFNSSALGLYGLTAVLAPYQCRFEGTIGGGLPNGKGINLQAGRILSFIMRGINSTGPNVVVGSTTLTGANLFFDGNGQESSWTWVIDPTAAGNVTKPSRTSAP